MADSHWAIDLGTTHTRVALWNEVTAQPRLIELPEICRQPGGENPLEAPRLVPSATHVLEPRRFKDKLGSWPFIARRYFVGRQALIGRQALERNEAALHRNFAPSFKLALMGGEALRPMVRAGRDTYTVREVARFFLRELMAEVNRLTGERIRDVALTVPVDAYESYRAELLHIARGLGIRRVQFIDEPVAAALGYGLSLTNRLILVVDFGGGTLHMVVASVTADHGESGACRVLAKASRSIGGGHVDQWLLDEYCSRCDLPILDDSSDEDTRFWHRLMLGEARRVKESLFFKDSADFWLSPPARLKRSEPGFEEDSRLPEFTRNDLKELLQRKGVFATLDRCLEELGVQCAQTGFDIRELNDVLLIGGSTLLPGIYPLFEEKFGRDRIRAWQPFEAVAFGACAFAAGKSQHLDFIVHDYAFVTYHPKTQEPEYTIIVPRGTRFPTPTDLWKRQLVPTCALGEPETIFKLVICEIGRSNGTARSFMWDASGQLHKIGGQRSLGGEDQLIVPLNESNPRLGYLQPPHSPSDRRPRLEISFGVNEDRWLCATVQDLRTKKFLMKNEDVVRLL